MTNKRINFQLDLFETLILAKVCQIRLVEKVERLTAALMRYASLRYGS